MKYTKTLFFFTTILAYYSQFTLQAQEIRAAEKYAAIIHSPIIKSKNNIINICSGATPCCCQGSGSSQQNDCQSKSDCEQLGGKCVSGGGYCN